MSSIFHSEVPRLGNYAWKALGYFNGYRLLIPLLIGGLYLSPVAPKFLGAYSPDLFHWVLIGYLILNIGVIILLRFKQPTFNILVSFLVTIDIICMTLLMHSSGGISSGLGMLLAISSASACLLLAHRMAIGFAAFASLSVLAEHTYRQWHLEDTGGSYAQAGILGATFFMTAIFSLILAQRAVESELKASERSKALDRLRHMNESVIQHMKTGVLVVDRHQRVELFNQAAWKLLGMPSNFSNKPLSAVNSLLAQEFKQWKKHRNYRPSIISSSAEGVELSLSFQMFSNDEADKEAILVFLEDQSTLTQTAQHLKLSSLGRLTGSIAHEIRNPLGALSHAAQLLEESEQLTEEDRSLLAIVLNHSERMNTIIENIMNLSQRKQANIQSVQLELLLLHFAEDFIISCEPKPQLDIRLTPNKISINFDVSQLILVLTNLCENAARFSHEKTGKPIVMVHGGVKFGTKNTFLDIIDKGQGVPIKDIEHIFEPFFTTSPKGSGLGLYLARELCEANGARLEYIPIPNGGSCFRINFGDGFNPIAAVTKTL